MSKKPIIPNATLVQEFVYTQQQLPIHKPIVQYIRQSTTKQLKRNKQSYELQDSDLRRKLTRGYGWQDNDQYIIKIDADQGKSGTKRRDERTGLDRLYYLLENDLAGAVAAFDVSRLYRVLSRAEYGTFCDMVLERRIPVITYNRIYWPTRTDNDQLADDFRAAAMFIEEIVKGKLIEAKNRHVQYDVSYGGHSVPIGYIVSGMGDEQADRKYYVIYEPHARLVRWLFRRFRELGGSLPTLARGLEAIDFHFPPLPQGMTGRIARRLDKDGVYRLRNRDSIIGILTNTAYIGYYEYGGVLVSTEAHEPIVPMDDFMYAYERLSNVSLDGTEQVERKPRERRYGGVNALLDGVLHSGEHAVYTMRNRYMVRIEHNGFPQTELAINVATLDKPFSQVLIAVLASLKLGLTSRELNAQIKALQQEQEQEASKLDKALARIDSEIDNAEMAQRVSKSLGDEKGYTDATKELVRLRKDRLAIESKRDEASREAGELSECHNLIECAVRDWQGMNISKRKRLVRLLHTNVDLIELSPHFIALHVKLYTPMYQAFTMYLYRAKGSKQFWNEQEDEILARLFPAASREELMEALPTHSWSGICFRGWKRLGIRRTSVNSDTLTHNDMLVMKQYKARVDRPVWEPDMDSSMCTDVNRQFCGTSQE